jgi:peptide deformylase
VGVNVRLMVFNEAGEKGKGEELVLVNPRILSTNSAESLFEEGCLSFPSIYGDVVVSAPSPFPQPGRPPAAAAARAPPRPNTRPPPLPHPPPHVPARVQRPTRVKVRAQDLAGKRFTFALSGFPARIFQHEYDHLQARKEGREGRKGQGRDDSIASGRQGRARRSAPV